MPNNFTRLAIEAITACVTGRPPQVSNPLPEELAGRAACFVSIKKGGELRGCVGTIDPTQANLADEITHNAMAAATEDPRFPPITPAELSKLQISVDVLTPRTAIGSIDELDSKKYGVVVSKGNQRGVLLPDLPGIDTVHRQLTLAAQKAGIDPSSLAGSSVTIYKFRVTRYH